MMDYSANQEAKHATNALLANSAALTHNMTFVLLRQHTWHTAERIEKRSAKINGAKIDGTNAECCLDKKGGWGVKVILGGLEACWSFLEACG